MDGLFRPSSRRSGSTSSSSTPLALTGQGGEGGEGGNFGVKTSTTTIYQHNIQQVYCCPPPSFSVLSLEIIYLLLFIIFTAGVQADCVVVAVGSYSAPNDPNGGGKGGGGPGGGLGGESGSDTKTVTAPQAGLICPTIVNKDNWIGGFTYGDTFNVEVSGDQVMVKRDNSQDWGMDLKFACC